MTDLVLFIGVLAILGVGSLIWKLTRSHAAATRQETQTRRRENARDWQRRFGPNSLLHTNFHHPTQNEILETLYVLDHLVPGWERGETEVIERRFLNELASSFPTLRKTPCTFPLPFAEVWKMTGKSVSSHPENLESSQAMEAEITAKRDRYRLGRAQTNAREQIDAGLASPVEVTPGSLPFRPADMGRNRRASNPWPVRLAGVAALATAILATIYLVPGAVRFHAAQQPAQVFAVPSPELSPALAEPSPALPAIPEIVVSASAAPTPASMAAASLKPTLPTATTQEKAALDQKIFASKQRAVTKYPALVIEGSEINVRFVFRYKNLVQTHSARLQEPDWPEQLAEECAAAAGTPSKHNAFSQILGSPR